MIASVALFSRRQEDGATLEQFHGVLPALAAESKLRDWEHELVRDLFIKNLKELQLQKKLFKKKDARRNGVGNRISVGERTGTLRPLTLLVKPKVATKVI